MPTAEEIRQARHAGFVNSFRSADPQTRAIVGRSYARQDANRESHITRFYNNLRGR